MSIIISKEDSDPLNLVDLNLSSFPDEVITQIALKLDYDDIMSLSTTSNRFMFLLYDTIFWRNKSLHDFKVSFDKFKRKMDGDNRSSKCMPLSAEQTYLYYATQHGMTFYGSEKYGDYCKLMEGAGRKGDTDLGEHIHTWIRSNNSEDRHMQYYVPYFLRGLAENGPQIHGYLSLSILGLDMNSRNYILQAVIEGASAGGHRESIDYYIDRFKRGISVNMKEVTKMILHGAIRGNQYDIYVDYYELYHNLSTDIMNSKEAESEAAILYGRLDVLKFLHGKGKLSANDLIYVGHVFESSYDYMDIDNNFLKILEYFFTEENLNFTYNQYMFEHCLHNAARFNMLNVMKFCFSRGAMFSMNDISVATSNGNIDIINYLFEHYKDEIEQSTLNSENQGETNYENDFVPNSILSGDLETIDFFISRGKSRVSYVKIVENLMENSDIRDEKLFTYLLKLDTNDKSPLNYLLNMTISYRMFELTKYITNRILNIGKIESSIVNPNKADRDNKIRFMIESLIQNPKSNITEFHNYFQEWFNSIIYNDDTESIYEIVEFLLENGAIVTPRTMESFPIHRNPKLGLLLLQHVDLNIIDRNKIFVFKIKANFDENNEVYSAIKKILDEWNNKK